MFDVQDADTHFILNILWDIHIHTYRFDYFLASVAFMLWFKVFWMCRVSETFGPIYKVLQKMIVDLTYFLAIWSIILVMFSCVGILMFGELNAFQEIHDVLVLNIQAALGAWDMSIY